MTVTLDEAAKELVSLIGRARSAHEEITICDDLGPVAQLVPILSAGESRVPGYDKGRIVMSPDFNDPLPEDMLGDFYP